MPAPRPGFLVQLRRGGYVLCASAEEAREIPGAKRTTPCLAIRGDTNIAGQWYIVDGTIGPLVVDQPAIDAVKARRAEMRALAPTPAHAAACGLDDT